MSKTMQQFCNRRQQENVKQLKEDYVIDMFVCRKLQVNILSTWTCLQQMNSVFYFSCKSWFHAVSNFRFWLKKKKEYKNQACDSNVFFCSFPFCDISAEYDKVVSNIFDGDSFDFFFFLHQFCTKRRGTNDKKADNFLSEKINIKQTSCEIILKQVNMVLQDCQFSTLDICLKSIFKTILETE